MELLPIEQERLLVELAPHSCEPGYLARRLDALDEGSVWGESGDIQALKVAGLIEYVGDPCESHAVVKVGDQMVRQTIGAYDAFSLTSNGVLYLRHCRRERIVGKVRLALEVAGSLSAIITLVLTILSAASASTVP